MNQIIQEIEAPLLKTNLPVLNIGDTVKVFVKIKEGGKEYKVMRESDILAKVGK